MLPCDVAIAHQPRPHLYHAKHPHLNHATNAQILPPCFHNDTNSSPRNSRVLITIQIPLPCTSSSSKIPSPKDPRHAFRNASRECDGGGLTPPQPPSVAYQLLPGLPVSEVERFLQPFPLEGALRPDRALAFFLGPQPVTDFHAPSLEPQTPKHRVTNRNVCGTPCFSLV